MPRRFPNNTWTWSTGAWRLRWSCARLVGQRPRFWWLCVDLDHSVVGLQHDISHGCSFHCYVSLVFGQTPAADVHQVQQGVSAGDIVSPVAGLNHSTVSIRESGIAERSIVNGRNDYRGNPPAATGAKVILLD